MEVPYSSALKKTLVFIPHAPKNICIMTKSCRYIQNRQALTVTTFPNYTVTHTQCSPKPGERMCGSCASAAEIYTWRGGRASYENIPSKFSLSYSQ